MGIQTDGLGLAYSLTEGPDGRTWIGLQFRTPFLTSVVTIDPDNTDAVAEMIAGELKRAGREARKLNKQAKLIIPKNSEVLGLTQQPGAN